MLQRLLLIVTVVLAMTSAWFFLAPPDNGPNGEPAVTDQVRQQAKAHIADITADADQPINIDKADNFVTASQLLTMPASEALTGNIQLEMPEGPGMIDDAAATAYAVDLKPLGATSGARSAPGNGNGNGNLQHGTLPRIAGQVTLQELLDKPENAHGKLFYIHAVKSTDRDGIWGILNTALIDAFAKGLNLPQVGGHVRVDIPHDADQRLEDRSSSFLGHLLNDKVKETYIYNYRQGLLGQNPDLIQPGQQLVVVSFSEDELVKIYNHFVNREPRQ